MTWWEWLLIIGGTATATAVVIGMVLAVWLATAFAKAW